MVGYNKEKLINFISIMDNYTVENVVKKQKIIESYYKIMMSDLDKINEFSKEIVSEFVMLYAAYLKQNVKNEKKMYTVITSDIITHELNRSLFRQKSFEDTLKRPNDVPAIQLLSMSAIANYRFSDVIAYLMVYLNKDLDKLFVDTDFQIAMLEKNLFTGNSFAEIEELIDASNHYNIKLI